MLNKAYRLTNNKDFQNIYRRGRYNATAFLSVNALASRGGETKVGIVTSKKVAKRAHDRNAVKRKVREIVRLTYKEIKSGQNIVISVRPAALTAEYIVLEKDLRGSFKRLGLFVDENSK